MGRRDQIALNIDIAATIVDAAGVTQHGPFDGTSMLPAMTDASAAWRQDFLIEHKMLNANNQGGPSYCGVRSTTWKFLQYQTGERELYDLPADPWEMQSRHGEAAVRAVEDSLHARMLELCRPAPPGWTPN